MVTEKAELSIRSGHPWVYDTEIMPLETEITDGSLTDVYSKKARYLGTGFYNKHSKITIRLISNNANDSFDKAFFERRLRYAVDYRRTVMGNDFDCCRLIFSEADQFPGFVIDRFGKVLVTQTLSLGIELIKPMLLNLIVKILREQGEEIEAIYERNDVPIRELEGMEQGTGFFRGDPELGLRTDLPGKLEIRENGIKYVIDYINGQKTGYFLDQKYNRQAVARVAKGKRVLDCFTHTGAFALNAAKAGAEHVTAVDVSEDALRLAGENAVLNDLNERITFKAANVFDFLTDLANRRIKDIDTNFDLIILDPPAFTKSRSSIQNALRGYKEINMKAMKLLPRGGYLATCSCSHFMTNRLFREMLEAAASDASVTLRQIEERQQSPDHPIVWSIPETNYLKFYLFQIV